MVRGHLTFSKDMTSDEMRQTLADFWGVHISQVPLIDKEKIWQAIAENRNKVMAVTAELNAKLISLKEKNAGKFEELEEVGRFIVAKDESMELIVPDILPKHPDFLIAYKGYRFGLEHTRLLSQELKNTFETVKYCLAKAQAILADELNHLSTTVNLSIDYHYPLFEKKSFSEGTLSRQEKEQIWICIADFVRSLLTGGQVTKPDFIYQFTITENKDSRIDINISERFITETNIAPALLERIADKEEKAGNYRSAIDVDLLGLLIVVDDLNSVSGFDLQEAEMPTITETNFDNIFLFEKQSGTIKSLYSNNSVL